jgi:hypothetical protein
MPRMAPAVTAITLAAAALELGLSGYYWQSAFVATRPWLPQPLQEEMRARFAVDRFIWKRAVPASARHCFLMAHIYACLGLVSITILAFANGPRAGGLVFAAISLLAIAQTVAHAHKYRRLH